MTHHWKNPITKLWCLCVIEYYFLDDQKCNTQKTEIVPNERRTVNDQLVGKTLFPAFSVMWPERKYKVDRSTHYCIYRILVEQQMNLWILSLSMVVKLTKDLIVSNLKSWLEARFKFHRLFVQETFDVYLLWLSWKSWFPI